jgi:3'-5' exoribonuclease
MKPLEKIERLANLYHFSDVLHELKKINYQDFLTYPGSSSSHHYFYGGLLQHTADVMDLCNCIASQQRLEYTDRQILLISALFHDYMKVLDYDVLFNNRALEYVTKSKHYYKFRHVFSSCLLAVCVLNKCGFKDIVEEVTHNILAHHQCKEWGSPVEPQTKTAWILHSADTISARCNEAKK